MFIHPIVLTVFFSFYVTALSLGTCRLSSAGARGAAV